MTVSNFTQEYPDERTPIQMSGQFGMTVTQEVRKSGTTDLTSQADFSLLGSRGKDKTNKMGPYKEGGDNDYGDAMFFNSASMFQPHRQDKDLMASQSQPLSQFSGSFYGGQQGMGLQSSLPRVPFPARSTGLSGHSNLGLPTSSAGMALPTLPPPNPASPNRGLLNMSHNRTSPSILPMQQKHSTAQQQSRVIGSGITPNSTGMGAFNRQASFGGQQSALLGNFGGYGNANDSSLNLDSADFPALATRGRQTGENSSGNVSLFQPNPMAGRPAYVGMVSKQAEPTPEFQMQSEDFPALPGANNKNDQKDNQRFTGEKTNSNSAEENGNSNEQKGIQIHPDGKVTNIPPGMLTDPFGMVGLLTFIRAAETDANLVQLALGSDLTTLGLNLNSPENLCSTFQSPWADGPSRPQDVDFHVPQEYLTNLHIRDKLAPIKLSRYGEDLLFHLYYTHGGDVLQLAAAAELYNRDWRYHKDERVWITRGPGMEPQVKTSTYERGVYYYFDYNRWCKMAKDFHLDYEKLEERPHLPASFHHNTSTNPAFQK
ncbi:CCR4-NOT transcription complex subunit 2-like [Diadema setosum]|uniref:CCR4-NOT transcription complex subunit 2-like n=1 Tax=Diadema setosum TaxID=31175 RepID=UPI003B3AFEA6